MTASNLGVIASVRGDDAEARRYFESGLAHARLASLADQTIAALVNLGLLHMHQRRYADADRSFGEARELAETIGEMGMLITVQLEIAEAARASGAPRRGARLRAARPGRRDANGHDARRRRSGARGRARRDRTWRARGGRIALPPRRGHRAAAQRSDPPGRDRARAGRALPRAGSQSADAPAAEPGAPPLLAAARAARAGRRRPAHARCSRATSSRSCGAGVSRSNRRTSTRRVTACASPISPARSGQRASRRRRDVALLVPHRRAAARRRQAARPRRGAQQAGQADRRGMGARAAASHRRRRAARRHRVPLGRLSDRRRAITSAGTARAIPTVSPATRSRSRRASSASPTCTTRSRRGGATRSASRTRRRWTSCAAIAAGVRSRAVRSLRGDDAGGERLTGGG